MRGRHVEIGLSPTPAPNDRPVSIEGASMKKVKSIHVDNPGHDYSTAPNVSFTGGGGDGAEATATVSGGKVTGIKVDDGGNGYTSAPTVVFTGGGGNNAVATASVG